MKNIFTISILLSAMLLMSDIQVAARPDPTGKKVVSSNTTNIKKRNKSKTIQYSGAKYVVSSQERKPLLFTKAYTKSGKYIFKTTYDIYNIQKEQLCRVIAIHNKKNKTVEVSVKDLQAGGFPIVNVERTNYETPFSGRFGAIGKVGAIGKGKSHMQSPGQLTLSFLSRKFDYVKVVHIADAHEDANKDLQVFILDE